MLEATVKTRPQGTHRSPSETLDFIKMIRVLAATARRRKICMIKLPWPAGGLLVGSRRVLGWRSPASSHPDASRRVATWWAANWRATIIIVSKPSM